MDRERQAYYEREEEAVTKQEVLGAIDHFTNLIYSKGFYKCSEETQKAITTLEGLERDLKADTVLYRP